MGQTIQPAPIIPAIADADLTLQSGYFQVDYHGGYNATSLSELGNHLVSLCEQFGVNGLLVDLTQAEGSLTVLERYDLVNEMSDKWPPSLHLAVVVRPSQTLKLMGFFWQRMAQSRGFSVHIAFEKLKAKRWLINHFRELIQTV